MAVPYVPTPTSGTSFSQIRAEYRYGFQSPTYLPTPSPVGIPLNDVNLRAYMFNPGPLPAAAAKPVGATRGVAIANFSVAIDTISYDVRGALVGLGAVGGGAAWTSASGGKAITVVGLNGTGIVFSTPGVTNFAYDTGAPWPATSSSTLNFNSPGIQIIGRGGPGGDGGTSGGPAVPVASWIPGVAGTNAGTALRATIPLTINTITTGSAIRGGGGGGGGGAGKRNAPLTTSTGGGGGGGGATGKNNTPAGLGGTSSYTGGTAIAGQAGTVGQITGGGTGGQNTPQPAATRAGIGGNGGAWGTAGQAGGLGPLPGTQGTAGPGGAAGSSITGFSLVTIPASVTRTGPTVP